MTIEALPNNTAEAASAVTLEQGYHDEGINGVDALQAERRYGEERQKRLRDEGEGQYVDITTSDKFLHFDQDLWVDAARVKDAKAMFPDDRCEVLILGAGFTGILYAIRLIDAGIKPENLRIVDSAGGFGGTWYYNRYPGLMCDVESYCYLPLLEETGYIPKNRYSYGDEIREYCELLAEKYGIAQSAVFKTKAKKLVWEDASKEWEVELEQKRPGESAQTMNVHSQIVLMTSGVLNWPKLPGVPGVLDYEGKIFHTSRFDYSITGGSQKDPSLVNLKDKRVAVIGTGATAVQVIPNVAKWAKHLYVVQRTPSGVDSRGQRPTDPEWFRENVATSNGWQRKRILNFHDQFSLGEDAKVNLVADGWTHAKGLIALTGNPDGPKTMEEVPAYIELVKNIDLPRQNRIRARTERIVKDKEIAQKLKPWYPSWCKRPCFHDEYLQTFNKDNVTLVDTDGKGLSGFTKDSIVFDDNSYPVDIVILATGYRGPFGGSPAQKANLTILGRDGKSMSSEWEKNGPTTLHGVIDKNFPNLFHAGPWQSGLSPNNTCGSDKLGVHCAYIIAEAKRKAGGKPFAVAPTDSAAEDWGNQMAKRALPAAPMGGCTPGLFNMEGAVDRLPPELQGMLAKSGLWGYGFEDYLKYIENWQQEGSMKGIEVAV